jgi:hypothetical protein
MKMKYARKRGWARLVLLILGSGMVLAILLVAWIICFPEKVIRYLYVNAPVQAELLVVEGWISDEALEGAVKTFNESDYSRIITTGVPLYPSIVLFEDGFLEYNLDSSSFSIDPSDTVVLWGNGTPAGGIWPHFRLMIDGEEIGEGFIEAGRHEYPFEVPQPIQVHRLRVVFDNDGTGLNEDRNLYIHSVSVGNQILPARYHGAMIYSGKLEQPYFETRTDLFSYAEECRERLLRAGIPHEKITPVPAPATQRNRTFSSALAVARWFDEEGLSAHSVNVFSEGIHARRTWFLYRDALKNHSGAVGIISTSNIEHLSQNPEMLRGMMIREVAGNLYYRFLFNKRKLKREFLGRSPDR